MIKAGDLKFWWSAMKTGNAFSDNFFNLGKVSYDNGSYAHAVMMFSQAVRADKENWQARYYLAKSCRRAKMLNEAAINFRYIIRACPDEDLCQRAATSLDNLESTSLVAWLLHPLQSGKVSATA